MVEGESTRELVNGTYMRDYFNVYFLPHVNRWWNDFIDPPVYQRLWGYPRMIKTKSFEKNKNGYRINEEYYRGPLLASQIKDQGQNTFIFDEEEGTPTRILLKLKLKYFICKNDHSSYELCGYCIDFYQSFFGIYIDYFSSGIKFKGIEYAQMAYYLGNRVCYIPRESITIFWTGRTTYLKLVEIILLESSEEDPDFNVLTDLEAGHDIYIMRNGAGLKTEYTVNIVTKSTTIDKNVMNKIIDLDTFANQNGIGALNKSIAVINSLIVPITHGTFPTRISNKNVFEAVYKEAPFDDFVIDVNIEERSQEDLDEMLVDL